MMRVVLADDHALVRAGLRSLLEGIEDVEVVGEAGDGDEALQRVQALRPDVVLMDISMPGLNGIEAIRRLAKLRARPRVLVLTMHSDKEYVRAALAAGADGYLLKTAERGELVAALAALARGKGWLSPSIARVVIDDIVRVEKVEDPPVLTPRQSEVLQLIAEGNSTKEIARRLQISVKTIETHRAQIMERLDIHNVAGLVQYAIRRKII
jgi:DNA-binding NarL/FixJ family response regulator